MVKIEFTVPSPSDVAKAVGKALTEALRAEGLTNVTVLIANDLSFTVTCANEETRARVNAAIKKISR
jgi:hypothetical protein